MIVAPGFLLPVPRMFHTGRAESIPEAHSSKEIAEGLKGATGKRLTCKPLTKRP
jgi:hypothetical protein